MKLKSVFATLPLFVHAYDPRCMNFLQGPYINFKHVPDYNFETFYTQVKSITTSDQCKTDLEALKTDIRFIESWGSSPSNNNGIRDGNYYASGNINMCHSVSNDIETSHCAVENFGHLFQGFCAPNSCVENLYNMDHTTVREFSHWLPADWKYQDGETLSCSTHSKVKCEHNKDTINSRCDRWCKSGLSITILVVIFSFLVTFAVKNPKYSNKMPGWFDLKKSWEAARNHEAKEFASIYGFKTMSMFLIILFHTGLIPYSFNLISNKEYLNNYMSKTWWFSIINFSYLAYDVLFAMAGFLAGYSLYFKIREIYLDDNKSFIHEVMLMARLVVLKWFKLAPGLLGGMFIWYAKDILASNKSVISQTMEDKISGQCRGRRFGDDPGSMLLFFNTFLTTDPSDDCFSWMWYWQNEFWYFVVAIGLSFLICRKCPYQRSMGFTLIGGIIFVPIFYRSFITAKCHYFTTMTGGIVYKIPEYIKYLMLNGFVNPKTGSLDMNEICTDEYATELYTRPWARCGVYFIAFLVGHFRAKYNSRVKEIINSDFSKPLLFKVLAVIIVSIGTMLSMLVGGKNLLSSPDSFSKALNIFYNGFYHEIFGTAALSLMFVIELNKKNVESTGCPITRFLRQPFWLHWSVRVYSAYVVHTTIIAVINNSVIEDVSFKHYFVHTIVGVIISFVAGLILFVFWESPCRRMGKQLMDQFRPHHSEKKVTEKV